MSVAAQLVLRGRKLANALRTVPGRRGLRHGVVPTLQHQATLKRLLPTLVVDVGANRGQFALDVLAAAPDARVLSFEPLQSEAAVFRQVMAGQPCVEIFPLALSDHSGLEQIHVTHHADSSSLHAPTDLQTSIFDGTQQVRTEMIEISTLDAVLAGRAVPERSLLKMDVQGHELAVLRGATGVLPRFKWVLAELSFVELYASQPLAYEVIDFLASHGLVLVDVVSVTRHGGRSIQADILFERHSPAMVDGVSSSG